MTLYEKRMRELYPDKYKDKVFNEEAMRWEKKPQEPTQDEQTAEQEEPPKKRKRRRKPKRKTDEQARADAISRDGGKCVECGATERLEVHHIRYKSQGGTDELDNLITLCACCHAEKHKEEPIYKLMVASL